MRSEAPGQFRYCSKGLTLFVVWDTELYPLDARVSLKFYSCADSQREAGRILRKGRVVIGLKRDKGTLEGHSWSPQCCTVTPAGQQRLDP